MFEIKFDQETIDAARIAYWNTLATQGSPDAWKATAQVFTDAANTQVRELLVFREEKPAPLFEIGKRYRLRNGDIVTVSRTDCGEPYPVETICIHGKRYHYASGTNCSGFSDADLLPGAIEDEPQTDWKVRAEKAEAHAEGYKARLEKVRKYIAVMIPASLGYADQTQKDAMNLALEGVAREAGFRILPEIPAQPLQVLEGE